MEESIRLTDAKHHKTNKSWILNTFSRVECIKYVNKHKEKCYCGRLRPDHFFDDKSHFLSKNNELKNNNDYRDTFSNRSIRSLEQFQDTGLKFNIDNVKYDDNEAFLSDCNWSIIECTKKFPTNSFGNLAFQTDDAYKRNAKYIRLSFDTKPLDIIRLMVNYWQLELPKLIISVHGGIANYNLQPKLKQAIQRGLFKVANTSQIWIITSGINSGVVKHIGDFVKEYYPNFKNNIVTIGIAPWGIISDRDSLIGCESNVSYYVNEVSFDTINEYNLNSFHSYFLLVDDGTVGKYGCEIILRQKLERCLSIQSELFLELDNHLESEAYDKLFDEMIIAKKYRSIPLVCLVIEGGTNTIQTVLVNVSETPPVPVVVCDGSGRASDLIAYAYKYVYVNPNTKIGCINIKSKEQLISSIVNYFDYSIGQAEDIFEQLKNCVKNKDLISIYRIGNDKNQEIDISILTASLKAIDLKLSKQLDVIMSWNRPDVAKKHISIQGNENEKKILSEKMFDALIQNKVDFVKLYLEYGVNLQKFLTFEKLENLYNYNKFSLLNLFNNIVKGNNTQMFETTDNYLLLTHVGVMIEKLIGNGYVSEYCRKSFKTKYLKVKLNKLNTKDELVKATKENNLFRSAFNDLMIWAVLTRRHKMALFFYKRGDETMAKALFAAKLNKSLSHEADDFDSEMADEFSKNSKEFAKIALGLLDRCYKEDDKLTNLILTQDLVNWSHWTCISLAFSANLKEFLSHTACQTLISELWLGGLRTHKYVWLKVILTLVFFPAIFFIQFKTVREVELMPQTKEKYHHYMSKSGSNQSRKYSRALNNLIKHLNMSLNNSNINERENSYKDYKDTSSNILGNVTRRFSNNLLLSVQNFYNETKNMKTSINNKDSDCNQFKIDSQVFDNQINLNDTSIHEDDKNDIFKETNESSSLKFGKKINEFYNAPITKFYLNLFVYIIFIFFFMYILLNPMENRISWPEFFVLFYILTYGFDKIREFIQIDSLRLYGKILIFTSRILNLFDILSVLVVFGAFFFRLVIDNQNRIDLIIYYRLVMLVNSSYWIIKSMEFLLISKSTGPLIIIASRMLTDLFKFLILLIIVVLSYGIIRQSVRYPNNSFSWDSIKGVLKEPYLMTYGEVFIDLIDPKCDLNQDKDAPQCQTGFWLSPLSQMIFLIVNNLLFLTILLSSFNETYSRIKKKSDQFWKYQRYQIITSYKNKPLLPPPLVVINHLIMVIKYIRGLIKGEEKIKFDKELKTFPDDDMVEKLRQFEDKCFAEFNFTYELNLKEKIKEKIKSISNRTEEINERIEDMYFRQQIVNTSIKSTETKLKNIEEVNQIIIKSLLEGNQLKSDSNNTSELLLTFSDSNAPMPHGDYSKSGNSTQKIDEKKRTYSLNQELANLSLKRNNIRKYSLPIMNKNDQNLDKNENQYQIQEEKGLLSRRQSEVLKKVEEHEYDLLSRIYNSALESTSSNNISDENQELIEEINENIQYLSALIPKSGHKPYERFRNNKIRRNSSLNAVIEQESDAEKEKINSSKSSSSSSLFS